MFTSVKRIIVGGGDGMTIRKLNFREKGYTFIELMLVVMLLSILATIAVLNYSDLQQQTTTDLAWADLKVLRAAIRAYYMKYQNYPADLATLQSNGYIDEIPKDKFSPKNIYLYTAGTSTTQCKLWSRGPNGIDNSGGGDDLNLTFGP